MTDEFYDFTSADDCHEYCIAALARMLLIKARKRDDIRDAIEQPTSRLYGEPVGPYRLARQLWLQDRKEETREDFLIDVLEEHEEHLMFNIGGHPMARDGDHYRRLLARQVVYRWMERMRNYEFWGYSILESLYFALQGVEP